MTMVVKHYFQEAEALTYDVRIATLNKLLLRNIRLLGELKGPPSGVETGSCQEFYVQNFWYMINTRSLPKRKGT